MNNSNSVISQKALLVQLKITQWSGVKRDHKANLTVETTHKTEMKVGNYQKMLLPGSKELVAVRNTAQNIRQFVDRQTLPWYADGTRILSSMNYLEFTQKFMFYKNEFNEAVNNFIKKYVETKNQAQIKLGDLYNDLDYPEIEDLKVLFECSINYMPVPDISDFRVEIGETEKNRFVEKMKQVENDARLEVYNRLKDVIQKAANKLSEPEAVFRDSLINNINEMLELVPALNITEDKELETFRNEIYTITSEIKPDLCRNVNFVRENTAKQLNEIIDKMSAFMVA